MTDNGHHGNGAAVAEDSMMRPRIKYGLVFTAQAAIDKHLEK